MTLLTVFRRRVRGYEELVFASDSRLGGGQAMDYGQKVFEMPRSDAARAIQSLNGQQMDGRALKVNEAQDKPRGGGGGGGGFRRR